jgi:predicted PurR-regulated permease PerM
MHAVQFRFDRFYRINRRIFLWIAILWLLYILRDFFALVFLTFLIVSFTLPVVRYFQAETRIPRKVIIVSLYLLILTTLVGMFYYTTPRITREAFGVASELGSIQIRVLNLKDEMKAKYPALQPLLDQVDERQVYAYMNQVMEQQVGPTLRKSARIAFATISTILLSLLFSFLIVLDLSRLTLEIRRLERSKLHDIFVETAEPVVRFAAVIAQAFRAQAVIAVVNTVLTLIGFLILGLPNVTLLTIVVFFFSFIPVLGVFISTTPAVLVAINAGGYDKAVGVIILVTIIHLIEAYVLNPLIYGRHLKLNPVLVLIILFVGHHFFGMWGMLLAVPVTYYFLYYVLRVPHEDEAVGDRANREVVVTGPTDGEPASPGDVILGPDAEKA